MREAIGDIWRSAIPGDAIVITTNGVVKADGSAVMGAGLAKQAADRDPHVAAVLGFRIRAHGNHVAPIHLGRGPNSVVWLSMPTKHHWAHGADLALIERSAQELLRETRAFRTIWMPRPGCGLGGLRWADVRPILEPILDDRFVVLTK